MDIIAVIIFLAGLLLGLFIQKILGLKSKDSGLEEELSTFKNNNSSLKKETELLQLQMNKLHEDLFAQKNNERELINEKITLNNRLSISQTNLKNLEDRLRSQKSELERLQEKFQKDFQLVADSILKQNSQDFSRTHHKELAEILKPLKEKIKVFEESIEKKYVDETKERSSLKQELKQLLEINKTLNLQAENLTSALKGDNKAQGNWGEMVLERILESSGLIKGEEYEKQFSDINSDNKKIQPDIIIKLPEEKHIIIDAKVSLIAYERYASETDEQLKIGHLKSHIISVKSHVKLLSEKNYQTGVGVNSPDFVLLFMPIEPSFTLAAQYDSGLFNYGWEKKVIIVSPTTLLATLKTIASVWKNERKFKNAHEISLNAAKLYDKFKGFIDDMQKIEKGINTAQNAYKDAFSKLSSGKGNLISRAEKFKELGVTPTKKIPSELNESNFDEK